MLYYFYFKAMVNIYKVRKILFKIIDGKQICFRKITLNNKTKYYATILYKQCFLSPQVLNNTQNIDQKI